MDRQRQRRRWWFPAGFAAVGVTLLVFYRVNAMHPSGQFLVRYRLWEFYATSLPQLLGSSALGPATNHAGQLLEVAAGHLIASVIGGSLAAGMGWLIRRRNPLMATNSSTS